MHFLIKKTTKSVFISLKRKKKVCERIKAILSYQTYVDSHKFPSLELFLIFKDS